MSNKSISLPGVMSDWVDMQVKSGRYNNASEYVRDLIRRDQENLDRRNVLIRALVEGEESGVSERSVQEIWEAVKKRHGNAADL